MKSDMFIDPKSDYAFKKVFRHGVEQGAYNRLPEQPA